MSLVFSITIMVSEIRMLSAATKTIRPMVMKVTRRSRRKRPEQGPILLHPTGCHETRAGGLLEFLRDAVGLVDVVDLELDYRNQIAQAEKPLRVRQACKRPGRVVVEKAGTEYSNHSKPVVLRDHSKRGEFALRAGDAERPSRRWRQVRPPCPCREQSAPCAATRACTSAMESAGVAPSALACGC